MGIFLLCNNLSEGDPHAYNHPKNSFVERTTMTIYAQVSQLIGKTPLLELTRFEADRQLPATLLGKVESFNPGGSIKDRVAQAMLDEAEASGKLTSDTVIIEPTSGNTGVGLAMLAATRGNQIIICMPETMSVERRNLMRAYGAQLELTEGAKGMAGAIARAEEFARDIPNAFIPSQFSNPANPAIHYRTTGPEIWEQAEGDVDALVCGVGTGGTISGAGAYLKEQNPNIQIIAVEPAGSPVLSGGKPGPHGLQALARASYPPRWIPISTAKSSKCVRKTPTKRAVLSPAGMAFWWVFLRGQPYGRPLKWPNVLRWQASASYASCRIRGSATSPPQCSPERA